MECQLTALESKIDALLASVDESEGGEIDVATEQSQSASDRGQDAKG